PALPSRRGRGRAKRVREALRIRLAHGIDMDALQPPLDRRSQEMGRRRTQARLRSVSRFREPEMAEAGLCRRDDNLHKDESRPQGSVVAARMAGADDARGGVRYVWCEGTGIR